MTGSHYKWCTYMLFSSKHGVFYTGITTDLDRRARQHNAGKGAKFTKGRGPWEIVAFIWFETKSEALKEECRLKKLSHDQKVRTSVTYGSIAW